MRALGADQLSRLLVAHSDGGWGFQAALTSTGRQFTSAEQLGPFLRKMGNNGYWNQVDVWFARDGETLTRSRLLMCLRQQATSRARAMCKRAGGMQEWR